MMRTIAMILIMVLCVTGTGTLVYQLYLSVLEERRRRRLAREYLEQLKAIRQALEGRK